MKLVKPNFIFVGAPKAGTTSIANYLSEHPEIFISKEKEPFYFVRDTVRKISKKDPMLKGIMKKAHLTEEAYYNLFNDVRHEKSIGEATVHYLYHYDEVIPKILKELGDIPIIIVLRNPVQRAFSNYKYQRQINSFEKSLELEEKRKKMGYNSFWFYKEVGNYYLPVKNYLENFSRVHIAYFEDLKKDPSRFMKEIFTFLDVNNDFDSNYKVKYNPTVIPKNKILHWMHFYKNKLGIKVLLPKSFKKALRNYFFKKNEKKINVNTLKFLQNYYKEDVLKLEKLLNKDLSDWYK